MTYQELIRHYTTQEAIAMAAGVHQSSVAGWKRRGRVPVLVQHRLSAATGGMLKPDRRALKAVGAA